MWPSVVLAPGSVNTSSRCHDRLLCRVHVHEERIGARAGEDAQAFSTTAILIVDRERDLRAGRGHTPPRLRQPGLATPCGWLAETTGDDELVRADRKLRGRADVRDGHGAETEPIQQGIGEAGGGCRVRQHVHHEGELARLPGARERVQVGDVRGGVGQGTRSGAVV